MKKGVKILIVFIILLVVICCGGAIAAFTLKLCPPPGPWPAPPWCSRNDSPNLVDLMNPPTETEKTATTQAPIQVKRKFVVTIPYWSEGEIYIGVDDNPTYLKLEHYNETLFTGEGSFTLGSTYFYNRGSMSSAEIPANRTIGEDESIYDAVDQWQDISHSTRLTDFQKGFYIGACHTCGVSFTKGNFIGPIGESMDQMKALGANYFDIMIYWFVEPDYTGNTMRPIYADEFVSASGWVHATLHDEDLKTLINMAHAKGLRVMLNLALAPEDWGPGVKGKGDLQPSDPELFFENYTKYITHYADLAEETGVELISIGSENDTLTQEDLQQNSQIDKTGHWRAVIKAARDHYSGLLTYSVSCLDENRCGPQLIKFWDDLDLIGWEWYVPIATGEHESIADMQANAERIIENHIKPLAEKYQKPVILAEIGWEAYPGACAHTYGNGPSKGGDRLEQASCYEAVFRAIEDADFIQGVHAFAWTASLPGDKFPWIWTDTANEVRFSITEKMFQKWYSYFGTP